MNAGTVLAGIIVIIVVFMLCGAVGNTSLFGSSINLKRLPRKLNRYAVCEKHDGQSALVIPMRADDNGIFLVDIGVETTSGGTEWISAAVDTGSESLLVQGKGCRGCEEGSHLGAITNASEKNDVAGYIRYGSQQDTVIWRTKTIRIPAWRHTCDLHDEDGAYDDIAQCVVGDVPTAVVQSRTGTSDYNILGLGSQADDGPPAVLEALFPDPPRAFQIHVHSNTEARLVIHRPTGKDCRPPKYKFRVRDTIEGYSHHYLLFANNISAFNVGPIGPSNTGKVLSSEPYNLLFDTGANAISMPAALYDALEYRQGVLSFELKTIDDQTVTIRLDYDLSNGFNNQILRSKSNLLVVGITFMKGHALGYEDVGHSQPRIMTLDFM